MLFQFIASIPPQTRHIRTLTFFAMEESIGDQFSSLSVVVMCCQKKDFHVIFHFQFDVMWKHFESLKSCETKNLWTMRIRCEFISLLYIIFSFKN